MQSDVREEGPIQQQYMMDHKLYGLMDEIDITCYPKSRRSDTDDTLSDIIRLWFGPVAFHSSFQRLDLEPQNFLSIK